MQNSGLGFYSWLSRLKYPSSYKGKLLLIAYVSTHVPVLVLGTYFLCLALIFPLTTPQILLLVLVVTGLAAGMTVLALDHLLAPVMLVSKALRGYLTTKALPELPTQFTDEVGTLMADAHQALQKLDEALQFSANYDKLTALPNRVFFRYSLQQALAEFQLRDQQLAVLSLDLDGFKTINGTLGHAIGDLLLQSVAQRLTHCIRNSDILCRLGSDEFAILQTPFVSSEAATMLAQRILETLAQPFILDNQKVHISASIGIAIYPLDGNEVDQLLRNADTAMHQAKHQGRSHYKLYAQEMNTQLQERLALENELRYAIARSELFLHYQPKVDLVSGQVVAVEALIRWQNPKLGNVSPTTFIPVAEESGLITAIGEWVLRTACQQFRRWQMSGLAPQRISINLSAQQFKQPNLVARVTQILAEVDLHPTCLELEVTESLVMEDVQRTISTLQQLKELGISLSLDDFGTGYSSMNYLQRFPIDTLKIDRCFVSHVAERANDAALMRSIIALAKSLGLSVTAEGVETLEQLRYLQAQGCQEVQGFYCGRPMTAEELVHRLVEEQKLAELAQPWWQKRRWIDRLGNVRTPQSG